MTTPTCKHCQQPMRRDFIGGGFGYWTCRCRASYLERVVRTYTGGCTDQQVANIVARLIAAEQAGTPSCAWHEHAVELGNLERCHCKPCADKRGARPWDQGAHYITPNQYPSQRRND